MPRLRSLIQAGSARARVLALRLNRLCAINGCAIQLAEAEAGFATRAGFGEVQ
jgi:hypothetical protein